MRSERQRSELLSRVGSLVEAELARARGENAARTIESLRGRIEFCMGEPLPRRDIEHILELHLQDFPFVVVSTSRGYFRPETPDEVNHYMNSLESRARCIFRRKSTVVRKALAEGFIREGKRFVARPQQALMREILQ